MQRDNETSFSPAQHAIQTHMPKDEHLNLGLLLILKNDNLRGRQANLLRIGRLALVSFGAYL
jgi:hypothetical protein